MRAFMTLLKICAVVLGGMLVLTVLLLYVSGFTTFALNGDYTRAIGDGWSISRCNSFHINLIRAHGTMPYFNETMGIGPLYAYAKDERFIYGRHYGAALRNHFPGDTLQEADPTKTVVIRMPLQVKRDDPIPCETIPPEDPSLKTLVWEPVP